MQSFLELIEYNQQVFVYSAFLTVPIAASCAALMAYIVFGKEKPLHDDLPHGGSSEDISNANNIAINYDPSDAKLVSSGDIEMSVLPKEGSSTTVDFKSSDE